jgi:AGZA family xanthine/uracil permease-like MFS transporter
MSSFARWIDRRFQVSARGSTLGREVVAGLATFASMAYVLIVHPHVLAVTGMDLKGLITVTALAAAIFSFIMGIWSNYPIVLAPAIGANVFFAVQICLALNIPWQAALGFVFYSGCLFFFIAVSGLRQKIIEAFPAELKVAITGGIGLFIAFVGLRSAGIIVGQPKALVTMGDLTSAGPLLALGGVLLGTVLLIRRVPAAILITILIVTVLGLFFPAADGKHRITPLPASFFAWPSPIDDLLLKLDLVYFWRHLGQSIPIVLALLFTDIFGSMAALIAICTRAGLVRPDGKLDNLKQALEADALAGAGGALLGTSTTHYYIESTVGVEEGGRTGLVAITVAFCFLAALVLNPIILVIPAVATAPALVLIGVFLMEGLAALDLKNLAVATSTALTLLLMLLGTIQDGLCIGLLSYIVIEAAVGRGRHVSRYTYGLGFIFFLHYLAPLFVSGPG